MANGYLPLPGGIGPAQPFPRLTAIASEAASGGSEASVLITAVGAGQAGVAVSAGGRTFDVATGFRLKKQIRKKGGSIAYVGVFTEGAGRKELQSGAIAARALASVATGAGMKRVRGASATTMTVGASADGFADDPELLLRLYASALLHVRTTAA